ncbi:MAG TPA: hypothetical protein VGJ07_19085 [Rugosimonospora sp.]|jgi:hypothetical protein
MQYLIVRTDIRPSGPEDLSSAVISGSRLRDESTSPETRRQTMTADNRDAALHLARALSTSGSVRNGRQRVKVIRLGF